MEMDTDLAVIPKGLMPVLQLPHVSDNTLLKDSVRKLYTHCMAEG
jgi:hypothetical protein